MCKAVQLLVLIVCVLSSSGALHAQSPQKKVLLFTKTAGFRHDNIEEGVKIIQHLFADQGILTYHTEAAEVFLADSISTFDAVVFFSTTGTIFNTQEKQAFQRYLLSGKGFMGIHAATDTEHQWDWYGDLVGGYFASHPEVQTAEIHVKDRSHPSTRHLQEVWTHRDEWYDFRDLRDGLHILMEVNEESYQNGKMGQFHPVAWCQEFQGIPMFYTALGHTRASLFDPDFQKHLIGGIRYVLAD